MKRLKSHFKWLYPGLKIKRWLLLAVAGIALILGGIPLAFQVRWQVAFSALAGWAELQASPPAFVVISGLVFVALGLALLVFSLSKVVTSIIKVIIPENEAGLVEVIYQRRHLKKGPKIVVLGGGTGLAVLLRGLKHYTSNLTAIVAVSDDGGCSGRLRGELGILPPGDLRNNLVALADKESLLEDLLNYRFQKGSDLAGRSLGNLLIAAMAELTGDMNRSMQELSKVLAVRGTVLPATLSDVTLRAKLVDGTIVAGESKISSAKAKIERVFLVPENCEPLSEALGAIGEADAVVIGPGSLYTSIIPNLLVKGVVPAINNSRARVFYISNVMTQPGETDAYSVSEHLLGLKRNVPSLRVDGVLVNTAVVPKKLLQAYKKQGAYPVVLDEKAVRGLGVQIIQDDILNLTNFVRHDSDKLAKVLMKEVLKGIPAKDRIKLLGLILGEKSKDFIG